MNKEKTNKLRNIKNNLLDDPIGLIALTLAGGAVTLLAGSTPIIIKEIKYTSSAKPIETTLAAGEHIISVPVRGTGTNHQYDYHEGYEVVGMNEKCILYVNTEDVTVAGLIYEDGKCEFDNFGTPVELEEEPAKVYYIK